MYYKTNYLSPLGLITFAASDESIVGLWFCGQKYYGSKFDIDNMPVKDDLPVFFTVKKWLDSYFKSEKPDISELKLAPIGSDFQKKVWNILLEIPYGECITYLDIAKQIAKDKKTMSAQAVGGAVGHNPISIIIPCHRVVGTNGSLTGYAGGIDKKTKLLEHESADLSRIIIPK